MKSLLLILLISHAQSQSVVLQIAPRTSACISEHIQKGDTVSFLVTHLADTNIIITLGTISVKDSKGVLLSRRELNQNEYSTLLPFNCETTDEVTVCVDNMSTVELKTTLTLKMNTHFQQEDVAPSVGNFNEMDMKSMETYETLQDTYLSWLSAEKFIQKMIDQGASFELKTTIFSTFTVVMIIFIGLISTWMVKKQLIHKKKF